MSARSFAKAARVLLAALVPAGIVHAQTYDYIAVTKEARAARQGAVQAGSLVWQCAGDRCTIRGPWVRPEVGACSALARAVGPLRSYGHAAALLSEAQMADCNAGAATAARASAAQPATGSGTGPAGKRAQESAQAPRSEAAAKALTEPRPRGDGRYVASGPAAAANAYVAETASPARVQGRVESSARSLAQVRAPGGSDSGGATGTQSASEQIKALMKMEAARGGSSKKRAWTCTASRCEHSPQDKLELYDCVALARQVGRIKSFHGPGLRLDAAQLAICNGPAIVELSFSVRSGRDDLRKGSQLAATLAGGEIQPAEGRRYDLFSEVPRDQRRTMKVDVLLRPEVRRIKLYFHGGRDRKTDTRDYWHMNELTVRAIVRDVDGVSREATLVNLSRDPIHTFQPGDEWEVDVLPDAFAR